ncbi:MAG: hypothetical protein IKN66_13185 [Ruminococcus sp.]|nr:hypothetical protein [Ruminococcus sp.]
MQNNKRKILLLVEGKTSEVELFNKIIDCFPEIPVTKQDVLVYNTSLWALNNALTKEFGNEWYKEEIDFIEFLKSSPITQGQLIRLQSESNQKTEEFFADLRFRDIFLIFDYERQDHYFNEELIKEMLSFWSESSENGLLYINYPMIEAYKHIKKGLPDVEYLTRKCDCSILFCQENQKNKYKQIVAKESSFTDLRKYTRELFRSFVIHNLCKASSITKGSSELTVLNAEQYWKNIDYSEILEVQNQCSSDAATGFVYVLATCLFFIPEYNSRLIFDKVEESDT